MGGGDYAMLPGAVTPLHKAAVSGSEELVQRVLDEMQPSLDAVDEYGRTPLMYAVHCGHTKVAHLLLSKVSACVCVRACVCACVCVCVYVFVCVCLPRAVSLLTSVQCSAVDCRVQTLDGASLCQGALLFMTPRTTGRR